MNILEYKLSLEFTHQGSDFNVELTYIGNEIVAIKSNSSGKDDLIIIPRHALEKFLELIK
jgi:hypothetical protein